jgi:hypothetical protein
MKHCRWCGTDKPIEEFYTHRGMRDGRLNKCKPCVRTAVSTRYQSIPIQERREYERARNLVPARIKYRSEGQARMRKKHPEKRKAWAAVSNAIRDGRLVPQPCGVGVDCVGRIEAHHEDYSLPLDVKWLCFRHHREHHGQTIHPF